MTTSSPLRKLHAQAEASFMPLPRGPATVCPPPAEGEPAVEIVDSFGDPESELHAIRSSAALLDRPDRATIVARGADRLEFLGRMLTQDLKNLRPFHAVRSFWLSRKGRIDADVRLVHLPDRTILDVDVRAATRALRTLSAYVIAEDVALEDVTPAFHRLALHGPLAPACLRRAAAHVSGAPLEDLAPGWACVVTIGGAEVVVDRCDTAGVPGLELLAPGASVAGIHHQLLETSGSNGALGEPALRPIGWSAYDGARIEAGEAVYYLDFGPESLAHETGAFETRVSLTKGCYLGQEIVARMHALGHPKQRLVAIRFARPPASPVRAGDQVLALDKPGDAVGVVTSAPKWGGPVCFAQVRYAHSHAGARLGVVSAGLTIEGEAQARLSSLPG